MSEDDRASELSISVTTLARGVVFHLTGPLGNGAASRLRDELLAAEGHDASYAILDLENVSSCDDQGVGAIIAAAKRAIRTGMRLVITAPSSAVYDAMEGRGLEARIEFRNTLHEVINELEG
ncbi:STAS domain-containing protein [Nonomuraea sp. NPDC050556]|uniref:STAS domain-containing protein n=1 Tax=Nonomuraea sp. NPDC050556 TaxID=3364369 RepID=UPI0037B7E1C9